MKLAGEVVKEVRFRGDGCAISIAAASLLTELRMGRRNSGNRIQCALLSFAALRAGIKSYKD